MKNAETSETVYDYIFIFAGAATTFLSIILFLLTQQILGNVFLAIGGSLLSVAIVNYLYRKSGGDPILRLYRRLSIALPLLEDQKLLGLLRVFEERRSVDFAQWEGLISNSHEVDVLGNVIRQNLTANKRFLRTVEDRSAKGSTRYRFLCYDPESRVFEQRCLEEEDLEGRMRADVGFSIRKLCTIRQELRRKGMERYLEIRLVDKHVVRAQILRTEKRMLVVFYLSSTRGSDSPAFELDSSGALYKSFSREFELMWRDARAKECDQFPEEPPEPA
jgi:hypothetical protein